VSAATRPAARRPAHTATPHGRRHDGMKPSLAVDLTAPPCLLPECQVPLPFADLRRPSCLLPGACADRRAYCQVPPPTIVLAVVPAAKCQVPLLIVVLAVVPAARCLRRSPCLLSCLLPSACCHRREKQRPTEQPSSRDRTSRATKPGQVPPPRSRAADARIF
jgi:hypothetical protein